MQSIFLLNNPDLSAADRIQPGLRIRFLHTILLVEGPAMDMHIQRRYYSIPVPLCVDRAKKFRDRGF